MKEELRNEIEDNEFININYTRNINESLNKVVSVKISIQFQ